MTYVSHRDEILARVRQAFWQSAEDVLEDARDRGRSRRLAQSGSVEHRGEMQARIRFVADFARARERGAFIRPRSREALKTRGGWFSEHTRLRAHPYLKPAGDRWGEHLLARLREVAR